MANLEEVLALMRTMEQRMIGTETSYRESQENLGRQIAETNRQLQERQDQQQQTYQAANDEVLKKLADAVKLSEDTRQEMRAKVLLADGGKNQGLPSSDDEGEKGTDGLWKSDKDGTGGWNTSNMKGGPSDSNSPGKGSQKGQYETYPRNRNLEEKSYRRVDKFQAGETEWQEFAFDVIITTRTLHPEMPK